MARRMWAIALSSFATIALAASSVIAQDATEDAELRAELARIIAEDPSQAEQAQKALDALDKPANTGAGRQARNRRERGARRIVNGLPARGFPAVAAVLKGSDPATASAWCTGTLVGCDKILTAAHCIEEDPTPKSYIVFFQELGFFKVKSIKWPKAEYKYPYFDLAMLTLEKPVEGIAPIPVNMTTKPLSNQIATIVGFGRTGGGRNDYGVKREGSARISQCEPAQASQKLLCWQYDADVKAFSKAANTCNGDSGGGVFIADDEGSKVVPKVFGVVSGGVDENCLKNDLSFNVDVREFADWIRDAGEGRLGSAMCGRPLFSGPKSRPRRDVVRLSDTHTEEAIRINVPDGVAALRISLNGEQGGTNDFDLYLHRPNAEDGAEPVCKQDGPGQYGFCEVRSPNVGEWKAIARRKSGVGQLQTTVSTVAQ